MMLRLPALLLGALLATGAHAAGFNYHYTDLRYNDAEGEDTGNAGTGYAIELSKHTGRNSHFLLDYTENDWDPATSQTRMAIGLGFHGRNDRYTDLLLDIRYVQQELDGAVIPAAFGYMNRREKSGMEYRGGMRFATDATAELEAGVTWLDIGDGVTTYDIGLLFTLNRRVSLAVSYASNDYVTKRDLGLRIYY